MANSFVLSNEALLVLLKNTSSQHVIECTITLHPTNHIQQTNYNNNEDDVKYLVMKTFLTTHSYELEVEDRAYFIKQHEKQLESLC